MTYLRQAEKRYDVLILGSGIAGLILAHELACSGMSVLIASKGKLIQSNTAWAQGGLAAVTNANPADSLELHLQDTLKAGAGLTDRYVAREILAGGQALVTKLQALGVNFDSKNGKLDTALEGGHSRHRVLHSKDASGRAIAEALIDSVDRLAIDVREDAYAVDLIINDGVCHGVYFLSGDEHLEAVLAHHTVLATGGLGQVYSRTTNPAVATGDGIAMAYRAGARLIDMEFVQFHPTALCLPNAPAALISEAVRGAGAVLLDRQGERFAFRFSKDGELATRDIVSRAIHTTMLQEGSDFVGLDLRPIGAGAIEAKFPNIVQTCRQYGIDPVTEPVPISPAAHYFMGGIWTDEFARTSLPHLYAIGECASTGLHGANRLASNSLLEGGVMAIQAARAILGAHITPQRIYEPAFSPQPSIAPMANTVKSVRDLMFRNVGLTRDEHGLSSLVSSLPDICQLGVPRNREEMEAANIWLLASLIANSALNRRESRGAHFRLDFPETDDRNYLRRYFTSKSESGWLEVVSSPIGANGVAIPA